MLGKFEKRHFQYEEKVWVGTYRNLTNILHWHPECELIRIVSGDAQVKIGSQIFSVTADDYLFCNSEETHYIMGAADAVVEIMIFHKDLLKKITCEYKPVCPLLCNPEEMRAGFEAMHRAIREKPRFYRETMENYAANILLTVFNGNKICPLERQTESDKRIIRKIHADFATVTFPEMVKFSGYGASHFSKLFKKITGMTFSDYLNYVKVENAVSWLQRNTGMTVAEISSRCGFLTIRNFNRVFRQITGYTPSTLPKDFATDLNIAYPDTESTDPTAKTAVLL